MTGYGRAQSTTDENSAERKITVEVRSLNGKSLDLSLRVPSVYRGAEQALRSMCSARIVRGKAEMSVQWESAAGGGAAPTVVNRELFRAYYKEMIGLAREVGYDLDTEPLFGSILRMPEVVSSNSVSEVSAEELATVVATAETALDAFYAFRKQEGAVLIADLLARVDTIGTLLTAIEPFEAERIETVRARLTENLEKAKVAVDNNRFEAEIIYFLEKFDVTEEKVRLTQHLDYFREVAAEGGDAGRKLGFITQEMGREINTLGSKANHHEMQRVVVQMKDELEKIKEQLLNIL